MTSATSSTGASRSHNQSHSVAAGDSFLLVALRAGSGQVSWRMLQAPSVVVDLGSMVSWRPGGFGAQVESGAGTASTSQVLLPTRGALDVVAVKSVLADHPGNSVLAYVHGFWVDPATFTALDALHIRDQLFISPDVLSEQVAAYAGCPQRGEPLDWSALGGTTWEGERSHRSGDVIAQHIQQDRPDPNHPMVLVGAAEAAVAEALRRAFRTLPRSSLLGLHFGTSETGFTPELGIVGMREVPAEARMPPHTRIALDARGAPTAFSSDPGTTAPRSARIRTAEFSQDGETSRDENSRRREPQPGSHPGPGAGIADCPACGGRLALIAPSPEGPTHRWTTRGRQLGPLGKMARAARIYQCGSCGWQLSNRDALPVVVVGPKRSGKTSLIAAMPIDRASPDPLGYLVARGDWDPINALWSGVDPRSELGNRSRRPRLTRAFEASARDGVGFALIDVSGSPQEAERVVGRLSRSRPVGLVLVCVDPDVLPGLGSAVDRPGTGAEVAHYVSAVTRATAKRPGWTIAATVTKADRIFGPDVGRVAAHADQHAVVSDQLERLGAGTLLQSLEALPLYASCATGQAATRGRYSRVEPAGNVQILADWVAFVTERHGHPRSSQGPNR